ncbi:acyltransferase family protein [Nocardioides sp. BGMRC 2183]|nr:acyltransferase family protein [Nocardioides sp. BGMRC 2183]
MPGERTRRRPDAQPSPQGVPTQPKMRDPWWDNAKMALVTLVVIGHAWTLLPVRQEVEGHLYDFLYLWHMPAFVFVTGYLSRGFSYSTERMWQLVRTVAVPYVIFECLMALFRVYVGGEQLEDLFRDPHWPLWYLAALFFWRLLTPVFRPLTGGLVVAIGISLAAGLWAGDTLDMARVLGMLPFFVLGLKATPARLEWLRGPIPAIAAVGVFVGFWFFTANLDRWAATEWLYYRAQYGELDVTTPEALATRAALLGLGMLGGFAFLALVPRRTGWFTRMGSWTLIVYLFHGFVVKGLLYAEYPEWAAAHENLALALTTVGAAALALLLAWLPIAGRLQHLVDPLGTAEERVRRAVRLHRTTTHGELAGAEHRVEERRPVPFRA